MSTLPPFVLVTGNPHKLHEAARILGFTPEHAPIDLPEIQSLDLAAVLQAKGEAAWKLIGRPLVVEDSGLSLEALGGFPGPLVKWMLEAVGAQGIAETAEALGNMAAEARCLVLYRDAECSVMAEGVTRGRLVTPPRGRGGFGWDAIFVPEGHYATYAELDPEAKDLVGHRGRAWRRLVQQLVVGSRFGQESIKHR